LSVKKIAVKRELAKRDIPEVKKKLVGNARGFLLLLLLELDHQLCPVHFRLVLRVAVQPMLVLRK